MADYPEISNRAEFIGMALKEASKLVEDLNEQYREQAFLIVLRGLIDGGSTVTGVSLPSLPGQNGAIPAPEKSTHLFVHQSVNEFFRMANPDSHVGRFVCAAYYLLHSGQAEHFSMADILEIYGKLRTKKPQNPTDTLNQCIRKAHIVDAPAANGQKSWVITPDGENYVKGLLLNGAASAKKPAN